MNRSLILDVWDNCLGKDQTFKGVNLASLAMKDVEPSNISNWSIEKRDVALFHVRKALFGNQFNNISHCPKCSQTVEWTFTFYELGIPNLSDVSDNVEIPFNIADYNLKIRLPNSKDLFSKDQDQIIQNCILNLEKYEMQSFNKKHPEVLFNEINYQLNKACHASNITYHLNCATCEHEWQVIFDTVSYLWKEIDQWAKNFLDQICQLAKAFSWSQTDIITMSENRRNHYLNLLNS